MASSAGGYNALAPAQQVWGIGHIREAILNDCGELYLSSAARAKFFRSAIGKLDKASTRELARLAHPLVYLDKFPFDCPDETRLRWYRAGVRQLNLQGSLPLGHRWTLPALLEYFPNVEEIVFPYNSGEAGITRLYRAGEPECIEPDVHNFVTSMTLNLASIPPDRFVPPTDVEYVRYCDFSVVHSASDDEESWGGRRFADHNLMNAMERRELPPILAYPIRRLSFDDDFWDPQLWINIFDVRKEHGLPTLDFKQVIMPERSEYFDVLRDQLGDDLRSVRFADAEGDLGSIFRIFTADNYPKLEKLQLLIEPQEGSLAARFTEPLPPNLKIIDIELTVYTFSLNQPERSGLLPEDRLPLHALRHLKEHVGPTCEVRARVITNVYADQPRLQCLVDEALGVRH